MLRRFEVENFKGFKDKVVLDLQAREYSFNSNLVKNGVVNKGLIYGKNGSGKSNIGIALFDIILHLTDKEKFPPMYLTNYKNYENDSDKPATFKYTFIFDNDKVEYLYNKMGPYYLIDETLIFNNKKVIYYNYFEKGNNYIDETLFGKLNIELLDNSLSVIKYIYRNMPTNSVPLLTKMMKFCENMLWFRSLSEGNAYAGYTNGSGLLIEKLYQSGKIKDFENFLKENEINYKLEFVSNNGVHELWVVYDHGRALFNTIASTGTQTLLLFFIWSIDFTNISFLFIDEFDAFFHYESAEKIVKILNDKTNFQSFLTSHNTYLMQNRLTRPDCCFIISNNKISNLFDATDKEIREAHNLEKMYINGVFNDQE